MRGIFNRSDVILFWVAFTCLMLFILSSCTWYRENTEKFYYDYAVGILKESTSRELKDICSFSLEIQYPEFHALTNGELERLKELKNLPYSLEGLYSPGNKLIIYSKWNLPIISHEAVHHAARVNNWNKWCLEELLAEMVKHSVDQDMELRELKVKLKK